MSDCNGKCDSCQSGCPSGKPAKEKEKKSMVEPANAMSRIGKVIGVASGKGGVGKSSVAAMLAVAMRRRGATVGVLDADVTGPSIPKLFGVKGPAEGTELGILPAFTSTGIRIMSLNLLVENEEDPVVWRGPVIAGTVKQFWTDVIWDDAEYLFVDLPPGTGDVPLTVFQSLPIDGIVVVTSPQDLVAMIVKKAVNMARMMDVPVLGLVENFGYLLCPDCGKKIEPFGPSRAEEVAAACGVPLCARLPLDPALASLADAGKIEEADVSALASLADALEAL